MSTVVLLDRGPLGLVTNPRSSPVSRRCVQWLDPLSVVTGVRVVIPEIADYEGRRELLRAGKARGIERLNALKARAVYLPLTTDVMLQAAEYWAEARRRGRPTADPHALDGDVILAAQAAIIARGGDQPIIATTNAVHLSLFVDARDWQVIP